MCPSHFPSSGKKAAQISSMVKNDWSRENPLSVLHPHEVKCAELYVVALSDPHTTRTMPLGDFSKWAVLKSGGFSTRFSECFGYELTTKISDGLKNNPAWRALVQSYLTQSRDAVLAKLKAEGLAAAEDFIWSRRRAKEKDDYKATREAAGDHLDRIGATEKPQQVAAQTVVILQGRNYTDKNLSEPMEAIVVTETPKLGAAK